MKKAKVKNEQDRRISRCLGCRYNSPKEYQPYPRLWPYLTCKRTGKPILDIDVCWEGEKK